MRHPSTVFHRRWCKKRAENTARDAPNAQGPAAEAERAWLRPATFGPSLAVARHGPNPGPAGAPGGVETADVRAPNPHIALSSAD